jgi:hypothetical protein
MKHVFGILGILLALSTSGVAQAAKVEVMDDDMYFEKLESGYGSLNYQVDKITQQCFVIWNNHESGGLTTISCAELAKRPEWKPLLTWIKEPGTAK